MACFLFSLTSAERGLLMDHDLQSRLIYELKILKKDKERYTSRLSLLDEYRGQRLKRLSPKDGCNYYCIRRKNAAKYKYAGKEADKSVSRIKEAAHITRALDIIDRNIALTESLLEGYEKYDNASIDEKLPFSYRSEEIINDADYLAVGMKWKAAKLAYQATFPENYPQNKTERTSDGTMVKTISEMVLYERLIAAGLIFVYELPLPSNDYGPNLYPDFTVLSPLDCKTEIIIEYVGRLDLPQYRDEFSRRLYRYMMNGYTPGVNLFFAFGDMRGHIDSLQVNKIIADILGVR